MSSSRRLIWIIFFKPKYDSGDPVNFKEIQSLGSNPTPEQIKQIGDLGLSKDAIKKILEDAQIIKNSRFYDGYSHPGKTSEPKIKKEEIQERAKNYPDLNPAVSNTLRLFSDLLHPQSEVFDRSSWKTK